MRQEKTPLDSERELTHDSIMEDAIDLLAGETKTRLVIMTTRRMKELLVELLSRRRNDDGRRVSNSQFVRHLLAPRLAQMKADDDAALEKGEWDVV